MILTEINKYSDSDYNKRDTGITELNKIANCILKPRPADIQASKSEEY